MREDTAVWLLPMMKAMQERSIDFVDFVQLITASTMPAAEADSPMADWVASIVPEDVDARAVDWLRFGRLLRHELGWDDTYPDPAILEY